MTADGVEPRWRVVLAFAAVYLIWGTTYFAIGEVVHTLPPFVMCAARFVVAGSILYAWRRSRGTARPAVSHWLAAAWISALLLLGGYGITAWAQQHVPSGLTALLVSATPLIMVGVEWLRPGGTRPRPLVLAGVFLGLCGLVMLAGPARLEAARDLKLGYALACVAASCCWATGSILSRQAKQAPDVFLAAAMQMLVGAVWLTGAAVLTGEFGRIRADMFTPTVVGGWLYLTTAGSLAAYSAYIYLLKASAPARVSTYAYVNPMIAVAVGWALGREVVTPRELISGGMLLLGVMLITAARDRKK